MVRTFEACGAGAFQMVDRRPGLSQLFEPGRELVTFGDVTDLREKLDYYLERPAERHTIAKAGEKRARQEHTYAHRLNLLLDTIGGSATGYPEPHIWWAVDQGAIA